MAIAVFSPSPFVCIITLRALPIILRRWQLAHTVLLSCTLLHVTENTQGRKQIPTNPSEAQAENQPQMHPNAVIDRTAKKIRLPPIRTTTATIDERVRINATGVN